MVTTQLKDVLKKLHWGVYDSSVYDVLIEEGPLRANDIALKANVPAGRIYSVLDNLEKKGYVKKRGKRPTTYDAQHPRFVIERELEVLETEAKVALASAEEAWEVRSEQHESGLENAWTVSSLFGITTEFRRLATEAKKSIYAVDPNIEWLQRKDQEILSKLHSHGNVNILSSPMSEDMLKTLKAEGINGRLVSPLNDAFYIFDGIKILIRVNSPDGAVVFESEPLAETLRKRFEELSRKSKDVEVRRVAD